MEYTKEQIVDFTINILGKISIPVAMIDDIGTPISSAIKNLVVVKQMMEMEENQRKAAQEDACETDGIDFGKDVDEDGNGEADAE